MTVVVMDWVQRQAKTSFRAVTTRILRAGAIPNHVAFIMDGNRRYARKLKVPTVSGHAAGFETLKETLEWCMDLGVGVVTVYAFSNENFKRSHEEVSNLMKLAEEKFHQLLEQNEMIDRLGVQIRVLGDVSRLPVGLQHAIGKAVHMSRHNDKAILNVCFAYTGREDITSSVRDIAEGIKSKQLLEEDVSEQLIESCLYTEELPAPDLVIRSSGEIRLSDFLLWQSGYSLLYFSPVLWPEFSYYDLLKCFLSYQMHHSSIEKKRHKDSSWGNHAPVHKTEASKERVDAFLHRLRAKRARLFASLSEAVPTPPK